MKRSLLSSVCLLLYALPPVSAALIPAMPPPLPVGSRAPALATKTLAGQPLTLKSLRGHVVLLDFWATWCGTCRMAVPTLDRLHHRFASRGLRVIGISIDDPTSVGQVPKFVRKWHQSYLISADPAANAQAAARYNAADTPTQFLIDKNGVIRWAQTGYSRDEYQILSGLIRKLAAQ